MIRQLLTALRDGTAAQIRGKEPIDACIECGNPSLPASYRCVDCVEN